MNPEELLVHMQDLGLGVIGQDLFRHHMPEKVSSGLLLTIQTPTSVNPYAIGYRKGQIQLVARAKTADQATAKANDTIKTLSGEGLDLPSVKVLRLYPRHEPLLYPKSEGALYEASVNFDIVFVQK